MRTTRIITGWAIVSLLGVTGINMFPSTLKEAGASPQTPPEAPDRISLTGHIRDFPPNNHHVDFLVSPSATPGARSAMNAAMTLRDPYDNEMKPRYVGPGKRVNTEWRDVNNNKIAWCQYEHNPMDGDKKGSFTNNTDDNGGIHSEESFRQWFRDVPGVNMSRLWTINLLRQSDGSYLYSTNDFNPIDHQLFGNGFDEKNFYFTYEIVCAFTATPGLFLEFKGDDDFWAYIVGPGYEDGWLMLDHGGVAANREQRVELNRFLTSNPGGQMVEGAEYRLHLFFAERRQPQSQFHLHTNIGTMKTASTNSIFAAFD